MDNSTAAAATTFVASILLAATSSSTTLGPFASASPITATASATTTAASATASSRGAESDGGGDTTPTNDASAALASFLSSLVFNAALSTGLLLLFLLLRPFLPAVYAPRYYASLTAARRHRRSPAPANIGELEKPSRPNSPTLVLGGDKVDSEPQPTLPSADSRSTPSIGRRSRSATSSPSRKAPSLLKRGTLQIQSFLTSLTVSDEQLLQNVGHDAFAAVFFVRAAFSLFLSLGVLCFLILIPIHIYGGNGLQGLDRLTFGNVAEPDRLWAHWAALTLISVATIYVIFTLLSQAAQLSHDFLSHPTRSNGLASRTLMIRDVPSYLRSPARLRALFDQVLPGSVHAVVVPRSVPARLITLHAERESCRDRLEITVSKYLATVARHVTKDGRKSKKRNAASSSGLPQRPTISNGPHSGSSAGVPSKSIKASFDGADGTVEDLETGAKYSKSVDEPVPDHVESVGSLGKRPRHRPLFYKPKVDTLEFELEKLQEIIQKMQQTREESGVLRFVTDDGESPANSADTLKREKTKKPAHQSSQGNSGSSRWKSLMGLDDLQAGRRISTVFVVFKDLVGPVVFYSTTLHEAPAVMAEKHPFVDVKDVIWENAQIPFMQRQLRRALGLASSTALVVFWASITAIVTSFTNLNKLITLFPVFSGLLNLPPSIYGLIAGILPPLFVSILLTLVPMVFRTISYYSGAALRSNIESDVLSRVYSFFVFNVLIITILSGSFVASFQLLAESTPSHAMDLLASQIPSYSTFFINYLLLLGTTSPTVELLQIGPLIIFPISSYIFGTTPRRAHAARRPPAFDLSPSMAHHTFVATIGLVYAVVAPLVLVFVAIYFGLYWMVYLYEMQNIYSQPNETGGRYIYMLARQLFVGLYIMQFFAVCLFALKKAFPQVALTLLVAVVTLWAARQSGRFSSVVHSLPLTALQPYLNARRASTDVSNPTITPLGAHSRSDFLTVPRRDLERDRIASIDASPSLDGIAGGSAAANVENAACGGSSNTLGAAPTVKAIPSSSSTLPPLEASLQRPKSMRARLPGLLFPGLVDPGEDGKVPGVLETVVGSGGSIRRRSPSPSVRDAEESGGTLERTGSIGRGRSGFGTTGKGKEPAVDHDDVGVSDTMGSLASQPATGSDASLRRRAASTTPRRSAFELPPKEELAGIFSHPAVPDGSVGIWLPEVQVGRGDEVVGLLTREIEDAVASGGVKVVVGGGRVNGRGRLSVEGQPVPAGAQFCL